MKKMALLTVLLVLFTFTPAMADGDFIPPCPDCKGGEYSIVLGEEWTNGPTQAWTAIYDPQMRPLTVDPRSYFKWYQCNPVNGDKPAQYVIEKTGWVYRVLELKDGKMGREILKQDATPQYVLDWQGRVKAAAEKSKEKEKPKEPVKEKK